MTAPPAPVEAVFAAMPPATRAQARALRKIVFEVAAEDGIERLEETLKWGQPAYLPGRRGTTVRLWWDRATGDCQVLVHCTTTLVEGWRARFADRLMFEGNRMIRVPAGAPLDRAALRACIAEAFAYHRKPANA